MDAKVGDATQRAELLEMLDRQKIRECIDRYCRGIDRVDADLLKSVYHPDGRDEHGMFSGLGSDFVGVVIPLLKNMGATSHSISNCLIDLQGDVAFVESYCTAFHADTPDEQGVLKDFVMGLRYCDRFEKRGGEWKIAHRQCVFDWNQNLPKTGNWTDPRLTQYRRGTKDATDFSYSMSNFAGKPRAGA